MVYNVSSKPKLPRGFRDFTPEIYVLRRSIIDKIIRVFERFGFDPIDTPVLEYWETLAGKYGEEAESRLIWRFTDPWSGRDYALRYDLTVPLARFIASHQDIILPFKRYHIGPVWRHEEPQKGRYREFYQCDADIVGSPYPEADAEIIELVLETLDELGFREFIVRVNDRRILSGVFEEELGLNNPIQVYRIIDKLDKIGLEGVKRELLKLGLGEVLVSKILDLIGISAEPIESLKLICSKYGSNQKIIESCRHLEEVFSILNDKNRIRFDMSLVRGLDYYTGPLLEVNLEKPRIGSIAGGGRYDNLIGMFLGRNIPATGVSLGLERLIDAGLELGIFNIDKLTVAEAQVIVLEWSLLKYAWIIARELRRYGVNTRIDLGRSSEESQRKKAKKLKIPILIFIGKIEEESKTATIYNTITGERVTVKHEEVPKIVLRFLNKI